MGFTLIIGEAKTDYDNDFECPSVSVRATIHEHPEAPAYDEPTDRESQRWPSYTSWSNFCEAAELYDLFYNEDRSDALLTSHPGCIPLTKTHVGEINRSFDAFMIKHPDAVATYGKATMLAADPNNPECNSYLVRLTWLKYWANWAIENCKQPVFYNS